MRWLWRQVSDMGPLPRFQHAMAYDSARDRVVLFGGRTDPPSAGSFLLPSDTWEWDGEIWTQVEDVGPAGRSESAMAYDSRRKRVVLHGGAGDSMHGRGNDTWEWDGAIWAQVADTGPSVAGHTMAYDPSLRCTLLYKQSTWAWDGAMWTELTEAGPPTWFGIAAFDGAHDYVVMASNASWVAGASVPSSSVTSRWDGSKWAAIADMGPIVNVAGAAIACDGMRVALFDSARRQTWEWDGSRWTQRQDIGPSVRLGTAMVGDTHRKRSVLFGGEATPGGLVADTWELVVE